MLGVGTLRCECAVDARERREAVEKNESGMDSMLLGSTTSRTFIGCTTQLFSLDKIRSTVIRFGLAALIFYQYHMIFHKSRSALLVLL